MERMQENRTLYVGNFPYRTTEEELRLLFEPHGEVDRVQMITDMETGHPKGFAFLQMKNVRAAEECLKLNQQNFNGRRLRVGYAKPQQRYKG